jgi:catechol 2,3-dioxygenase-like lactoylglutathione lyase family enzyme
MVQIKTHGFLHITISVTDLDRATDFYQNMLGCELVRKSRIMSFMKTGDDFFVLTTMPNHTKPNSDGPLDIHTTLFHHAMIVDREELNEVVSKFEAERIEYFECTSHGHTTFPGRRHIYIMDPDGNSIELVTPPQESSVAAE